MQDIVIGPIRGYFVATYACPVGEFGKEFLGYYKLYARRPEDFCAPGHLLAALIPRKYGSIDAALHAACLEAKRAATFRPLADGNSAGGRLGASATRR